MKEICKNCLCYNDGWCEAFVVQKLPNTKGCFGFIPKEPKEDSMNYKLNVQDGKVDYLMMAGKDIVKAVTTEERAQWAMDANGVKYECIGGHPEYAIHCGEFFFASVPVKPKKRKKDVVCE